MDTNQLQMLSLQELKEMNETLEHEYKEKQKLLKATYDEMTELSKQYVEIQKIIDKRQGKGNK